MKNQSSAAYQMLEYASSFHYKLRYALALSLKENDAIDLDDINIPDDFTYTFRSIERHEAKWEHQYDAKPRNKSISQLLRLFHTKRGKQDAGIELLNRLPYVSFAEQKKIITTLVGDTRTNRESALKFLILNWDEFYAPMVEEIWKKGNSPTAARIIVHHFPQSFIEEHKDQLIKDYNYLQVRLRLPKDAPIDRSKLYDYKYLHLCSHLGLEVPDEEAERILYQMLAVYATTRCYGIPEPKIDILAHSVINSIVWSLGKLGKTKIIFNFALRMNDITRLLINGDAIGLRSFFESLNLNLDIPDYENIIPPEFQRIRNQDEQAEFGEEEDLENCPF